VGESSDRYAEEARWQRELWEADQKAKLEKWLKEEAQREAQQRANDQQG
jgi:hypothetical protein